MAITYDTMMERMLSRIPNTIDKREGSIIFDALAPAAMEMVSIYEELEQNAKLSFVATTSGEYLTLRCSEYGVNREPATQAKRKGYFYGDNKAQIDVPLGSRFLISEMHYVVRERLALGEYVLECEIEGEIGNKLFGPMLPIQYVDKLVQAELGEVLVGGEEEEDDDTLRARYFAAVNEKSFGGNVADYKKKLHAMDGVGGVKVFPTWQGGGTVKCTLLGSNFKRLSDKLLLDIQNEVDPTPQGTGIGLAPIGHKVKIANVQDGYIYVEVSLVLEEGITAAQIKPDVEVAVESYFHELRKSWEQESQIVVRIAQIEARILGISGVKDILDTQMIYNGQAAVRTNVTLGSEEVPVLTNVGVFV